MNRLLFVYFENLSGFRPFSMNFSNEFTISFEEGILSIEKKENLFVNLTGPVISDINAIAGQNGAGKTTLLRAIASVIWAEGRDETISGAEYEYLYVYQTGEFSLYVGGNMVNGTRVAGYRKGEGMGTYEVDYDSPDEHDLDRPMIYYSPFLDFNLLDVYSNDEDKEPIIDISTSQIIMDDLEKNDGHMEMVADILFHKTKNIKRHLNFINSTKGKFELPFHLPGHVEVHFTRLNPDKEDISVSDYMIFEKLSALCATQLREHSQNKLRRKTIAKVLFLRNLLTVYFISINADKSQQILSHRFNDELLERIENFKNNSMGRLIRLIEDFFREQDIFPFNIFERCLVFINKLLDDTDAHVYLGGGNDRLSFQVATDDPLLDELFGILNYEGDYQERDKFIMPNIHKFVSFDWRNLSSGEKTFLDLFSRMHVAIPLLKNKEKSLLILLDEGEVGFHPSWQIHYVSYLCGFFNAIFEGYTIQLVIATHSPLVLSDFPRERVHLFKNEPDRVYRYKEETFGTFAQNTSVLLANEFFVEDSLIGDLAKKYIDNLLEQIENVQHAQAAVELANKIATIDEPIIQKLLFNKLEEIRYAQN